MALARHTRGDPEAHQPGLAAGRVHQDVGRLDVLVDQAAAVNVSKCSDDTDSQAEKAGNLHRTVQQEIERRAARILQHQHRGAAGLD